MHGRTGMTLLQRGLLALSLWRDYRDSNLENVDSQLKFHQKLTGLIRAHVNRDLTAVKILEIGCGQRASQTILFQAEGAPVIGIDREIPTYHLSAKKFFRTARVNGWERAFKSLGRHVLFDRQFFQATFPADRETSPPGGGEVCLWTRRAGVPDEAFDFIFSSWFLNTLTMFLLQWPK